MAEPLIPSGAPPGKARFTFWKNIKPSSPSSTSALDLPKFITLKELAEQLPGGSYDKLLQAGKDSGLVSRPGRTWIVETSNVKALVEACKCLGSSSTKTATGTSKAFHTKGTDASKKLQAAPASKSKKPNTNSKKSSPK